MTANVKFIFNNRADAMPRYRFELGNNHRRN